jgi:predicted DNA repair protein MutK
MPALLAFLSFVGMLAMLWVGGGILLHGLAEFGIDGPEQLLHNVSEVVRNSTPVGATVLSWLVTASAEGLVGLAVGALIQIVMSLAVAPFRRS